MSCPFFLDRWLRLLLILGGVLGFAFPAGAVPRTVLPFGADTWRELHHSRMRPLVAVFSTTDCTHCPQVIDSLAAALRKSRAKVQLVVVVMDGAGREEALRADRHYRKADQLYVFHGDTLALRFKVTPDWRGVTPYVALIPASGETLFHSGTPPQEALQAFLRP